MVISELPTAIPEAFRVLPEQSPWIEQSDGVWKRRTENGVSYDLSQATRTEPHRITSDTQVAVNIDGWGAVIAQAPGPSKRVYSAVYDPDKEPYQQQKLPIMGRGWTYMLMSHPNGESAFHFYEMARTEALKEEALEFAYQEDQKRFLSQEFTTTAKKFDQIVNDLPKIEDDYEEPYMLAA